MKYLILLLISGSLYSQIEVRISSESNLYCRLADTELIGNDSVFYNSGNLKEVFFVDAEGYKDSVVRFFESGELCYAGKNFNREKYYSMIYEDTVSFASSYEKSFYTDGSLRSSGTTVFYDETISESYVYFRTDGEMISYKLLVNGKCIVGEELVFLDPEHIILNVFKGGKLKEKIFITNPYDESLKVVVSKIEIVGERILVKKRLLKKYMKHITINKVCNEWMIFR